MKKNGENTDQIFAEMKELSNDIKADDEKVRDIDEQLRNFMLRIPNIPNPEVPVGKDDTENVELRKFSEPRKFDFEPKAHWDIGTDLDILDFERGTKIAGTRFTVYKGLGARLERAVIQFFLNTHTGESGYTEIFPPYMVNRASMTGTLTNSKKEITPFTRETLLQAQEKGLHLVLASGRPTYGIVPLAEELNIKQYGGFYPFLQRR